MNHPKYYFSTRDLLVMAAMAALGGVASTYINFIGDFFQSFLGFAGTTQWAAGLHVLWLVLAVGLTRKPGTGTVTGILKGAVELFSGNTHGLLVLLVDLVAGILVDVSLLPFRRQENWTRYALAGGLASAANVFVFQLFAAVPADILTAGVIGLITLVAFISGVIFAGILGAALLSALRSAGVISDQRSESPGKRAWRVMLVSALVLAGGLFVYLKIAQSGGESVAITGAVSAPYQFDHRTADFEEEEIALPTGGVTASYRGYPLAEILGQALPDPEADMILLLASDGYAFFVSEPELSQNPGLALQAQGKGKTLAYNMIGPESKKAWVNGVVEIRLIRSAPLTIEIAGEDFPFHAGDWVGEMDSTTLDLGSGPGKYQGVPLGLVLASAAPGLRAGEVTAFGAGERQATLDLEEVLTDQGIRIFIDLTEGRTSYSLATLDGDVYLPELERIRVR